MKRFYTAVCLLLLIVIFPAAAEIPSPESVFGFKPGADRKLMDWIQISDYLGRIDRSSDRVSAVELGKTTLGKPMALVIVGSESALKDLARYQNIQKRLANPYDLTEHQADSLILQGKVVVLVSMNIHSTEIASSQEAVELVWELATGSDAKTKKILDNVILLLIPSLNPDGLQMVVDWYRRYVGTPYEGCPMPTLYHHYAGHDNNRDWFMFNLEESRLVAPVLYRDWYPEIVYDQHQMGSTGARLFVPPYIDPVNLNIEPALMAEVNMLGKHVIADLHVQGFKGVASGESFNAYFEGTMSKTPLWHNMVGILSEMASARIASPIFFPRGSLGEYGPELPRYSHRNDFLNPWEGGWWRLRDIVEYEKAVTYSILDLAATYREKYMKNFYRWNRRSIDRGRTEPPYAYLIPFDQHDPNSAVEMLLRLRINGVRIYSAEEAFTFDGRSYPEGTAVIPLAQPCRPCIKDLMEPQMYPNLMDYPGGPPTSPYDFAGWTLPLQMGVRVVSCNTPLTVSLKDWDRDLWNDLPALPERTGAILWERRYNNSVILVNRLLRENRAVYWLDAPATIEGKMYPAGTFAARGDDKTRSLLEPMSKAHLVPLYGIKSVKLQGRMARKFRLGIYQPWTACMDEGWTRWVLDHFEFDYTLLHNSDILKGRLSSSFDAIILPSASSSSILNGTERGQSFLGSPKIPEPYGGGLGKEGVEALSDFIAEGGTLIALGSSCDFAIEELSLPAVNTVKRLDEKSYFVPGSLLQMQLDESRPLSFGMQTPVGVRFANSPAFRLLPYVDEIGAVGYFGDGRLLLSGWLIGEEHLSGKTILAEIPVARGKVVLFAFGVQSRAQTYGTFKLLFNAILGSAQNPAETVILE